MLGSLTGQVASREAACSLAAVWQDEAVRWRSAQTTIVTALTLLAVGVLAWLLATGAGSDDDSARAAGSFVSDVHAPGADPANAGPSSVYATVDPAPVGPPLPRGFLGLSLEYSA